MNKGAIVETPNHLEGNLSATFFSWIKKMGKPTSNKLETPKSVHTTPKSVHTLPSLQYGGLALFSKHSKEGRLHVQNGLERCIFFSSVKSCIQNICAVPLVRESLQVSLLLLWARPGTKNFYKITQNSSFIVALPEHTNYDLLGRHVVDRPYNRRNVNGQRHSNLPSPTTTAYTEFKEISVDAYTENRVPRGIVDSLIMTLSLPEKKVSKVQKQCQELLQKTQVSILELTKIIGLLSSTIQSVLPAQINFRYVQQQQIQALKT